ncbi:MAG: hypothetical protein HYY90_00045 [Candidatus Omnitrophica bacterium]|nr:hypothetical protein [Candidatus Omnitrophota bacterium]MBI3082753.1 hypothetical protein [Candidatus Omnitrophota bacterium]
MEEQANVLRVARPLAASRPFRFYTSLVLQESTGLRASTLSALAKLLRSVPESSVYHHTHHFLLQHHYLTPEPTNDFAYWVTEVLGETPLGERLAGIDTMDYVSLHSLREALAETIERYLAHTPTARLKFVSEGQEFFFLKSVHVIMPIPHAASTLAEFCEALRRVSVRSLYFHIFDARLRLGRATNDFAIWVAEQLGLEALGARMSRLDPYAYSLETLRATLLSMLNEYLGHPDAEPRSV